MNLFYLLSVEFKIGDGVSLTGDDANHIDRVLKLNAGEEVLLSNGIGAWAIAKIRNVSRKLVELEVIEIGFEESNKSKISVAQALIKSDRSKEAIELLTASGVDEIIPWQAARSIGKESSKWESVVFETGKQARRFWLPTVHEVQSIEGLIALSKNFDQVLICHESATEPISKVVKNSPSTLIVIGPEGGLTNDEIQKLNGKVVKLGKPILRSAHAGIAAVAAVSALIGNW